jgi:ADP-ribose pyrophosphatase YjhB (NUDIX family)
MSERSRAIENEIVSALIWREGRLLMVEAQGPEDLVPSWGLPGGRVEARETLLQALVREVHEETGLAVEGAPRLAFSVRKRFEDLEWMAHTFECVASGTIAPDDPDELILSATWFAVEEAIRRLDVLPWYDSGPLRAWLEKAAPAGTLYDFTR